MITAKEARERFNNSELIAFLKKEGQVAVERALEKNCCGASFSLYDAPSKMSRSGIATVAKKFFEGLEYKVSISADNKTIYLEW